MEELADARKELEKVKGENPASQKMFQAIYYLTKKEYVATESQDKICCVDFRF